MKRKKINKNKIIALCFVLSMLLTSLATYKFVEASFSGSLDDLPYYVGAPNSYSYLITTNGTHYFAFNGTTGENSWTSTNNTLVQENVLNALSSGTIFLNEVEWNSSLTVPANVMVTESYQGQITYYNNITSFGQQIFVPYNGKIADINEADTNKHTLDLAAALSETREIVMIVLSSNRIAGTGNMLIYNNEVDRAVYMNDWGQTETYSVADGTNRLQYAQSVANDDWDWYCMGYVVEA